MVRLAKRFGTTVAAPEVSDLPLRSAFEVARDNAKEGCVRETFGAMVAMHQAAAARDLEVREAMETIAQDELCHAGFSWALATWLEPRLTDSERALVCSERAQAMAQLREELDLGLSASACDLLGYPDPASSARLHAQLSGVLAAVA